MALIGSKSNPSITLESTDKTPEVSGLKVVQAER